jgi:Domain of unknown function (DUF5919)
VRAKRQVFVAHVFDRATIDDLRSAIATAAEPEWEPIYADAQVVDGHILTEKIIPDIQAASVCLFEISQSRPNVFLELGLAKGFGKPCVLLLRAGLDVPSDLAGYDRVVYESYKDLTDRLRGVFSNPPTRDLRIEAAVARTMGIRLFPTSASLPVRELLAAASAEVRFQGLSGNPLETIPDGWELIRQKANAGCRFRFLYMHPQAPDLIRRSTEEDGKPSQRLSLQSGSTLASLSSLRRAIKSPSAIELRLCHRLIPHALIVIDGSLLLGPYLFAVRGIESPWLQVSRTREERWFDAVTASFDRLWDDPDTEAVFE